MARDWLKAFRAASFRGVPFKVKAEEASGSRRLSISPIAYAERSVIEDMGRDPREMRISAYCAGELADTEAKALIAVLDRKGAGRLVLPMLPALRARVEDWHLARQRDVAGHVAIDITFIEEGLGAVPFGLPGGAGLIGALIDAILPTLQASTTARTSGLSRRAFAAEAAAARVAAGRFAATLPLALNGRIKPKDIAAAETALAAALEAFPDGPAPAGSFAAAQADAWRVMALRADAEVLPDLLNDVAIAATADQALTGTLAGAGEAIALTAALSACVLRPVYTARQDATAARDRLRRTAAGPIEIAPLLGDEVSAFVMDATGEAAMVLSRIAASRAPLIRVETGLSLSSIRAAWELYGNANRAGELVDRNRVATPALMPTAFEAVSD